ncbi:MAG: hypothetical protein ACWA6U_17995 [Breznakibacter sp.]
MKPKSLKRLKSCSASAPSLRTIMERSGEKTMLFEVMQGSLNREALQGLPCPSHPQSLPVKRRIKQKVVRSGSTANLICLKSCSASAESLRTIMERSG